MGAGGSQRAAEGSEGQQDTRMALAALFIPPYLASKGCIHLEEPSPSMDREELCMEGLQGLPGHPNPAGPTDLLPWARLGGHSWGQARARPPEGDGPRARDAAPGAEHKTHGTRRGESGRPAARLVIWSVYMAGGQGAGQEGQWQRIYIKIKGEEGRKSERERARSWLRRGTVTFRWPPAPCQPRRWTESSGPRSASSPCRLQSGCCW